jgi:hypothetical protein
MQFGLFSNGERQNQVAKITYDEDLAEVILADELGLQEAWISEHGTFVSPRAGSTAVRRSFYLQSRGND